MSELLTAHAADNTALRYRRTGNSGGPNRIVLIHSLAMDGAFWDRTADVLGDGWEVLTLDCRGHGRSDKPAGPYTVETFGDDVAAVMDHAGWTRAAVAGASMGGCVALAFAARHGERLTGLGLVDTTAFYGEDAPAAWETRGQKAVSDGMGALVEFQKTRWFSDAWREANPEEVSSAVEVFLANDVPAYLETCRMLGRADLRDALPTIRCPVEIIVGEEDYATPLPMAEAMRDAIPDATLTVLPGVRHFTPIETPEGVGARLARLPGC